MSYIDLTTFRKLAANMGESAYGIYLSSIAAEFAIQQAVGLGKFQLILR